MMEALTSYGRPFHQRGTQLKVGPLNPADVAAMAGLSAAEAFDAALVTGGPVPLIAVSRSGTSTTHVDAAFTPADLIAAW